MKIIRKKEMKKRGCVEGCGDGEERVGVIVVGEGAGEDVIGGKRAVWIREAEGQQKY